MGRITNNILSKRGACIIISLMVLINTLIYASIYHPLQGDQSLSLFGLSYLYNSLFIWQPLNYSGIITAFSGSIGLLIGIVFTPIQLILSMKAFEVFDTWLFLTIGGIGIFLLVLELSKKFNKKFAFFGAYVSAIFFTITFTEPFGGQLDAAVFLPWVFLLLYRVILSPDPISFKNRQTLLTFSLLTLAITITLSIGGAEYFIQNLSLILFFSIFVIVVYGRKIRFYRAAITTLISILLALAIFLPTPVTNYLLIQNQKSIYNQTVTGNKIVYTQYSNGAILYAFSMFTLFGTPYSIITIFLMLLFFVAVFGSLLKFDPKDPSKVFVLGAVISYFLFLNLSTLSTPFSGFITTLYSDVPYTWIFLVEHSYPILTFLSSLLIGYAVANISGIINNKHNVYLILFIVAILIFIVVYLYNYDYIPIEQNTLHTPVGAQALELSLGITNAANTPGLSTVPAYVYNISNYINSQNGTFSVGTLPEVSPLTSWQVSNWYTGTNVYQSLIKSPVYTGLGDVYDEGFSPWFPQSYYNYLNGKISTSSVNYSISNIFSVFGIKYIIIQGDTLHMSSSSPLAPVWNESMIYYNLNRSKSIKYVTSYNTSAIFEVINYTPLVYSSNIKSIGNSSSGAVFDAMGNSTFDTSNTAIYTTQSIGLYNSSGKIPISWISNFKQADISFDYSSPTRVDVKVSNATSPFYLVFRETYDPGWNAFYSNGSMVNQSEHIQVNGFANAWYITKTGNYTMTLYYAPQTLAWITWAISLGALGFTICIGCFGLVRRKRR